MMALSVSPNDCRQGVFGKPHLFVIPVRGTYLLHLVQTENRALKVYFILNSQ